MLIDWYTGQRGRQDVCLTFVNLSRDDIFDTNEAGVGFSRVIDETLEEVFGEVAAVVVCRDLEDCPPLVSQQFWT